MIPINFMLFFTDQWPYIVAGIFLYAIIFISLDKTRETIRYGKDSTAKEKPVNRGHKCRDMATFLQEWQEFEDDVCSQESEDQEVKDDHVTESRTTLVDNARKAVTSVSVFWNHVLCPNWFFGCYIEIVIEAF